MSDLQHERAVELEDEIASLRAELTKHQEACQAAGVRDGNLITALRAELTYAKTYLKLADDMSAANLKLNAIARQDAEEKARLREALILARREISDHDSDYHHRTRESTIEAIRAALACTPTGMPSGVQQAEEIARLRDGLQTIADGNAGQVPSRFARNLLAALACRPQEKLDGS